MNVIARLEFELVYYDVTDQHVSHEDIETLHYYRGNKALILKQLYHVSTALGYPEHIIFFLIVSDTKKNDIFYNNSVIDALNFVIM